MLGAFRAALLSTSALTPPADAYAVGGNAPEFVADFAGVLNSGTEYYRSGGADTTFSSVFTHSGLVLPATMTDSDGVLKWGAHNLLPRSDNFSDAAWAKTNASVSSYSSTEYPSAVTLTSDSTSGIHSIASATISSFTDNQRNRVSFWLKQGTADYIVISCRAALNVGYALYRWSTNTFSPDATLLLMSGTATRTSVGSEGFFRFDIEWVTTSAAYDDAVLSICDSSGNISHATSGLTVIVGQAAGHKVNLGGMINNPDRGDSYVPTTTAARFLPRRNHYIYNGTSWENAGLLIEPAAATNNFANSNNFTIGWAEGGNTETVTQTVTGPSGQTNSAWTFNANLAGGTAEVALFLSNVNLTVSTTYTFSAYCKANTNSFVKLGTASYSTPANGGVYFDLSTGAVGTQDSGYTGRIQNVGNGWYRCSVTFTLGASDGNGILVFWNVESDGAAIASTNRDGTGVYIYGAQLESGAVATSYIPTVGNTVTRAAETLTVAGANLPANTTGVSVQMQGRMTYADLGAEAQRTFWRWYNGASDFLLCDLDTDGADTGEVNANQSDTTGGAGTVAIDAYSPGINVAYNIASRHSNTDINLAVDGTAGTADATPTALHDASSDTFQVAHNLQGTVGMLRVWGVGLSDTDLESAT